MKTNQTLALAVALCMLLGQRATAQESAGDLAQELANPIADLISLPLQNNTDFGIGPYDRTSNVLNIQPVVPFANGRVITRTILPIVWIPDVGAEEGMLSTGLADIVATAFYVPKSGNLMWGLGPVVSIPTGGELRGMDRLGLGPSGVLLYAANPWTLGLLANNIWSIGGDSDREASSKGLLQYFIVRQLGDGWYVNSAPIMTANWKADDDKFIVPFGAGAGRLIFFGKLPVNIQLGAYYNVIKPDGAADWQGRIQIQLVFPTP